MTELEHPSEPHRQAASSHSHNAISQAWEEGAWTSDEKSEEGEEGEPGDEDQVEPASLDDDAGGESDNLPKAYSDIEDDWEAEVGNISLSAPQEIHHGHLCSSAISASPAVTESLELYFRLNITLITDRLSHGRPETSFLVYVGGVLGFSSDRESFQPARCFPAHACLL